MFSGLLRVNALKFVLCIAGLVLLPFLAIPDSIAVSSFNSAEVHASTNAVLPAEFGQVIYSFNGQNPNQIYIVGMSHRDALSGKNGANTARTQAELYKIGEWLIRNKGVELLLPEGFFSANANKQVGKAAYQPVDPPMEMEKIEELLQAEKYFNAESFLKEVYPLWLDQVEDRELYYSVKEGLNRLSLCENPVEFAYEKAELDYLQEMRTAKMLQNIPDAVEQEFSAGNIREKKALFTTGLAHLNAIIKYFNQSRIQIHAPLFARPGEYDVDSGLKLIDRNFGVTVIIPKSLMAQKDVFAMSALQNSASN